MFVKVLAQSAASIFLHGCVAGLVFAFSSGGFGPEEQVYHVTLAEFASAAPPAAPASPPPPARPDPPKPDPVVEAPLPEPVAERAPVPKAKKISTKKTPEKAKPVEETKPTPAPRADVASASQSAPAGPAHNIGGFAAYDVDTVDQRPSIVRSALPEYPQKARRMNKEGTVFVRVVVDTEGKPRECAIHAADPAGFFEESALAAARKTRFIPGKLKGKPVNTVVLIPFVFALR